jgi:hypothetical protein
MPTSTLTTPADPADIPITSPVVEYLPELLDVHRLTLHIHRQLIAMNGRLPEVLSGWVLDEARGCLCEAYKALCACSQIVQKGDEL